MLIMTGGRVRNSFRGAWKEPSADREPDVTACIQPVNRKGIRTYPESDMLWYAGAQAPDPVGNAAVVSRRTGHFYGTDLWQGGDPAEQVSVKLKCVQRGLS